MANEMVIERLACTCGSWRVRGDSCGDCDLQPKPDDPMEINKHVVRRKQIARRIDELVEQKLREDVEAPSYWDIVLSIADEDSFNEALTPFLGEESSLADAEPLAEWIVSVLRARQALRSVAGLRPHAEFRAQFEVLGRIAEWWPIYREVATTTDRTLIESKRQEGQRAVDTALSVIRELWPTLEALSVMDDYANEPSLARRQLTSVSIRHDSTDFAELERIGSRQIEQMLKVPCPPGMGLQSLMLDVLAEGVFLPGRFRAKVSEAASLWRNQASRVRAIAGMQNSVDRLGDATVEFSESFVQFDYAIKTAPSTGAVVRAAKKLLGAVYEEAQPLWSWSRLLVEQQHTDPGDYLKIAESNATTNVKELTGALPSICEDAETFYRNATLHGGAVVADDANDEVIMTTRRDGERRMSTAELIDRLYALVESVLALHWVMQVFMRHYEVEIPARNDMPSGFAITTEDEAFWHFTVNRRIYVHHNEICDGIWQVEAQVQPEEMFASAVLLAMRSDQRVREIRLSLPGQQDELMHVAPEHVQSRLVEESSEGGSDDERVFRLFRYKAASIVDGVSLLTDADLHYGAVVFGYQLLTGEDPLKERAGRIRQILNWAEARGLDETVRICKSAMRVWRADDVAKNITEEQKLLGIRNSVRTPEIPRPRGVRIDVPQGVGERTVVYGGILSIARVAQLSS